MNKVFLTQEAKNELETRLNWLKTEGRLDMANKIRTAREYGDISENAEYDIAKEDQAKMEAEIVDIEQKLANVEIIVKNINSSVVSLGSTVRLFDAETNSEDDYKIVGSYESNPVEYKISNESPIGRALMGRKPGDIVVVDTTQYGGGKSEFRIVSLA